MKKITWLWIGFIALGACNLSRKIEVPLPKFEPSLVVECYLVSGQQLRALVTRSNSFFDTALVPEPAGGSVTIEIGQDSYNLKPQLVFDSINRKFYNFIGDFYPVLSPNTVCRLRVKDEKGGPDLTAQTVVMPIVKIDSLYLKFNSPDDTLAYLSLFINDNPQERNFYRVKILSVDSYGDPQKIDFELSDVSINGQRFPVVTRPRYLEDKEVQVFLYHLSPDYYDFLNTVDDARGFTSGNPFFQPAVVKSNIKGGIGIFTVLSYDVQVLKAKK
jgi:hypothetical protein